MYLYNIIISLFMCLTLGISTSHSNDNLPRTMVWSVYDIGASGYNEASAIAEGIMKK